MSVLGEGLSAAERGEALWLSMLRERMGKEPGALPLLVRLHLHGGETRDFRIPLAKAETEEEEELLRDYLRADLFNILSACGGEREEFFWPEEGQDALLQLAEAAADDLVHGVCSKPFRVNGRIIAAAGGGPLRSAFVSMAEYRPLPEKEKPSTSPLGPRLRARAERGSRGLRCGLDVGGTDIKLAIARDGELLVTEEYDWAPSRLQTAEELMGPILSFLQAGLEKACPGEKAMPDSLGLSFPDVVIRNRILGGETPKTRGIWKHDPAHYEEELRKLSGLNERLEGLCRPGTRVRVLNDGGMAAFAAAMELACAGEDGAIARGVFAHSLGTDLGSGWLRADGTVPEMPLELYDLLIDLGSVPQAAYPPEDLRSTRNENSGLPGARRYLGQAAAYRLAWELDPRLLAGFTAEENGVLCIRSKPEDLRKPCLEHLMTLAEEGDPAAEEVFRRIGVHLGQISREIRWLLAPETDDRFLFGRFVRHPRCFALIREGCAGVLPELRLIAADGDLAASPLMEALSARGEGAVARFGQAIGALYYGIEEEEA